MPLKTICRTCTSIKSINEKKSELTFCQSQDSFRHLFWAIWKSTKFFWLQAIFREVQKSKYSQVSYKRLGSNKREGLAEVFIFTGLYEIFSVSGYQSHKQPSGGRKVNVRLSQEFIFSSSFSYTQIWSFKD